MEYSLVIETYKTECDQLFKHFKTEAENKTALGSAKQRVRKKDTEAFAEIFNAFGVAMEIKAEAIKKNFPELDQQLTTIYKLAMIKFVELGRELTSRIN